mgnify:CR=1 FL=1
MAADETIGTRAVARNVRLFLAEGSMQGLVVATVGNWTGQRFAVPRSRIAELLHRTECSRTGTYILEGPDPDRAGGRFAYVGEADDVAARCAITCALTTRTSSNVSSPLSARMRG